MQGIQGGVSAAVEKEVEKMPEAPRHRRFRCREALRGVQSAGDADAATAAVLAELADLVARGEQGAISTCRRQIRMAMFAQRTWEAIRRAADIHSRQLRWSLEPESDSPANCLGVFWFFRRVPEYVSNLS